MRGPRKKISLDDPISSGSPEISGEIKRGIQEPMNSRTHENQLSVIRYQNSGCRINLNYELTRIDTNIGR